MHGLNTILRNRGHLIVLRVLFHAEDPLSGRAIERLSGLSNRATMGALDSLVEARAVHREEVGNAYHFTLNRGHYLVAKVLRAAFDAEELFWDDVSKTVRRVVRPRPIAAVATGPLARDESEYEGRLMLTLLFSTGRSRIRALESLQTLAETVHDRYGLSLEHTSLDKNTMDREEYDPLWKRVEREGILLFGTLP